MSEILEIRETNNGFQKNIKDIPHYPKFEEIIDQLTHSQLITLAKTGYEVTVELKGGVIDE